VWCSAAKFISSATSSLICPRRCTHSIRRGLKDAWEVDSVELAKRQLERLAASLEREHPGAAASLREGLEETLTVQRLGLTGALARTLRTTNPIENLNGHSRPTPATSNDGGAVR
jgi:hypothetical protein